MHKRSKRILTGIGIVAVALGAAYAASLARSTAQLSQAYAALEQDGRPMNAADVIPPDVPEEQNAAPLYEDAAATLKALPAEKKDLLEYLGNLSASFVGDSLKPEQVAKFKQLMAQEEVAAALSAVAQGTQRPTCRLIRDYRTGFSDDLPILADWRRLACILGGRACLEGQAGQSQQAWDTVRTQLRFTDSFGSEPIIMGQVARWSQIRYLCRTVQELCEIAPPSMETSQMLESFLNRQDDTALLVHTMDVERLLKGEWLFHLPEDELYKAWQKNALPGGDPTPGLIHRLRFRMITFRPRFVADHAMYLQLMRKGTQLLANPYSAQDIDAQRESQRLAARHPLTDKLVPMIDLYKEFHCRMVAEANMTRAGLALLQYRKAHDTFPQTLDVLEIKGLIDPFTQEPLHYRVEPDGFVIYSVAEDLKDNGGRPRQPREHMDYDIIWRFPRPTRVDNAPP